MDKKGIITMRVNVELKKDTASIFSGLGLTTSAAVTMFLKKVQKERNIDFLFDEEDKNLPAALRVNLSEEEENEILRESIKDAEEGRVYSLEEFEVELDKLIDQCTKLKSQSKPKK